MLLFVYLGFFTRPMYDDLCLLDTAGKYDLWANLLWWRENLNGSFSGKIVHSLLVPLGFDAPQVFPAILISIWFVCTAALLYWCLRESGIERRRLVASLSVAALIVAAICASIGGGHTLYFFASSIKYTAPLVFLSVYLLLLAVATGQPNGRRASWLMIAAAGALCFLSAGFAELLSIVQLIGITLMLTAALLFAHGAWRRRVLTLLGAGWLATVASMIVMLTAPGLWLRLNNKPSRLGVTAYRSLESILHQTWRTWHERISDPDVVAGFVLLLAVGLFASLVLSKAGPRNIQHLPALRRNPFLIGLLVQLLLLPLIWQHQSDHPQVIGQFSGGYFVVIVCNAVLLIGLALVLWRQRQVNIWLANRSQVVPIALLAWVLLFFALTQFRSIHWRASTYLLASLHSLLLVLAWQLSSRLPDRVVCGFAVGMGCLYATLVSGVAAVALGDLLLNDASTGRLYAFSAHLPVWLGLAWGVYLGYAIKSRWSDSIWLKTGALAVALYLGCAIVVDYSPLAPDFQQFAQEYDIRHARILERRQAGERELVFPPLSYDLPGFLNVNPRHNPGCHRQYYDLDTIDLWAE